MTDAGDLGRRIGERRRDQGLSLDELAERAGMSPGYLAAVERDSSLQVSPSALWRLAAALDVTVEKLQGGGLASPTAPGSAIGRPALEPIDAGECATLVAAGGVGRFVFDTPDGPAAVPVNYRVVGTDLVFLTEPGSPLARAQDGPVALEVDRFDDDLEEGWSVLATGRSEVVTDPDALAQLRDLPVQPWAAGDRSTYVRLRPDRMSGRRIRSRPDRG